MFTLFGVVFALAGSALWAAPASALDGAAIYQKHCVSCHGTKGQGVPDKYDESLTGDKSIARLAKVITRSMPEEDPKLCVGEDAEKVAEYIFNAFYSPAAQARNQQARIELSRLTVRQYLNATSDLLLRGGVRLPDGEHGLSARYHASRSPRNDKMVLSRVDPIIDFDFGTKSPQQDKMKDDEFSITWRGSIVAEETGDYEICVVTQNGFKLKLNHTENELIDGWVASGPEPKEHRATIRLLGGRAYPIEIDYFKFKEKSASFELRWKPPHHAEEVIPARNLRAQYVRPTFVSSVPFPPDDSSVGYERGVSISKAWDSSTTQAAIEFANLVAELKDYLGRTKESDGERVKKIREFCHKLVARAFRRPLTDAQKKMFVDAHFEATEDLDSAIKRVVIMALKSPRFLYLGLGNDKPDGYVVAERLSFGLWDSLPDDALLKAAEKGQLDKPERIAAHVKRMLGDERAKSKIRYFLAHWLQLEHASDLKKDEKMFPGFDEHMVSDLRTSLNLLLEDVVWSESSDYRQLLLADYMFVNDRLAKFYGIKKEGKDEYQRVSLDAKKRSGVLTHPFLLSAFSYHNSTSPIHRGVFLTRNMMGRSLKPPPNAVEFNDSKFDPSWTMREKVAELTRSAACQNCHSVINPLGFSLENYDAVGRFRTTDNKKPVNATSDYPTETGATVRITGARDLAKYAVTSPIAQQAFVEQLFHQVVKQPASAYGEDTLKHLRQSFEKSGFNVRELVVEILKKTALHGTEQKVDKHAKAK